MKNTLSDNTINNSIKQKKLSEQFNVVSIPDTDACLSEKEIDKKKKTIITEITKLMAGNKGSLSKIFDVIPLEVGGIKTDIKLSEEKYETEIKDNLAAQFPDEINGIDRIKELYDWSVLQEILPNNTKFISEAKVASYKKHEENLLILKNSIFKTYFTQKEYNDFFRKNNTNNYVQYVGTMSKNGKKIGIKKCKEDDFYSNLTILCGTA